MSNRRESDKQHSLPWFLQRSNCLSSVRKDVGKGPLLMVVTRRHHLTRVCWWFYNDRLDDRQEKRQKKIIPVPMADGNLPRIDLMSGLITCR